MGRFTQSHDGCSAGIDANFNTWPPGVQNSAVRVTVDGMISLVLLLLPFLPPPDSIQVVHTYPHDRQAFTEGLLYYNGFLYEGTGLEGHSVIRKVKLETGEILQERAIPPNLFGEGIAILNGKLYEMTYQTKLGMIYDLETFQLLSRFTYEQEGWGMTTDGHRLLMSDGSDVLRWREPDTFAESGKISVTDHGHPVQELNELEWVEGEIYANVWKKDVVARISPKDGHVIAWISIAGLKDRSWDRADVANGIAYDAVGKRLFVTGKWWPKLFEIRVVK